MSYVPDPDSHTETIVIILGIAYCVAVIILAVL